MKYLLIFLLIPFLTYSQIQLGSDIDGEAANDSSGRSVSLSSDGTIVAIGATGNDGNGSGSGHVRIYKYNSGNTGWTQLGADIDGEAEYDTSGYSVSLSSDGTIVAIGAIANDGNGLSSGHVRIYKYNGFSWNQLGADIDGEAEYDTSGYSVSLSSDGTIVAISAPDNDGNGNKSGHVRIYKYNGTSWIQLGADINGEASLDYSGYSISLSNDGNIVAIGAHLNDGNGPVSGHVRVYQYDSKTTNWIQLEDDIDGEVYNDVSGFSISLSSDGHSVAIGAPSNTDNGPGSGHVRVYKYYPGKTGWIQLGADIDGEAVNDSSGWSVSLSGDGNTVAIGAQGNDGNGIDSGHVRVYKYNLSTTSWIQLGIDIDGEAAGDFSGGSVSLSSDGNTVAIGATRNDKNGIDSGHVRVYDLSAVLSTESFNQDFFSYYPNPVKDELNINLNNGLDLKQVNIYNIQSQYLYSAKTSKIDVSNLSSGIYFIEVETNQGKSAKKIVKE